MLWFYCTMSDGNHDILNSNTTSMRYSYTNKLGCIDMKSRRDVRPQGGVMSRICTEVARL